MQQDVEHSPISILLVLMNLTQLPLDLEGKEMEEVYNWSEMVEIRLASNISFLLLMNLFHIFLWIYSILNQVIISL